MGSCRKSASIHSGDPEGIRIACDLLASGNVIALPTETVYGLAANALDEKAVLKIFEIKNRPLIDPLIVHFGNYSQLEEIAYVPQELNWLANAFWPGPLTVILKKRVNVPNLVTAGRDTVAVRMPAHPIMLKILQDTGLFLAAPSANPFGYVSPTTASHVADSLGDRLEHILDGGPCGIGVESTILDFTNPQQPGILRKGPITVEELSDLLNIWIQEKESVMDSENQSSGLIAPGTLSRHYSPKTRLVLCPNGEIEGTLIAQDPRIGPMGAIFFKKPTSQLWHPQATFFFSENGDLSEATHNLFHLLREVDKISLETVFVEMAPADGIGDTINDRLKRAAAKTSSI
jgi:L-threonylcarbamoyladenylate synthase